ncbi:dihydropteroate synthase [Thalassolituus sp. UBA2009]|uniref:dihydropteroate synthase n=1 Tax=Thalassolituus sp. UBA2009 TaxID=1947658 RepID=UPI00257DA925|nr:dihydropteroate synthase [Thalassolituus sp. UBA2009]
MKFVCGNRQLDLSVPRVMGILNVTPDSFSDGGRFTVLDNALRHAEQMLSDGAALVDVGGESTRPGAAPVSEAEELERVVPVIEAIVQRLDVAVSVDTSNAEVIRASAQAGAHLINDVRALTRPGALAAAAASGLPVCLMHMNGEPQVMQAAPHYDRPIEDAVVEYLAQRIAACEAAGIGRERLLLDPGFGFGKTFEHNFRLLNRLERLHELGLPLLTGLSRKRMIGEATGNSVADERIAGSVSGAVICALKGAKILRVHDVKQTTEALRVVIATQREGHV